MKKIISLALALVIFATSFAFAEPVKTEAEKTFQKVLLDGEQVELEAYLINQRNYVKLRDIAALLTATEAKFNVGFDKETKKVLITKGEAYEKQENDLTALPEGKQEAVIDERPFVFDGEEKMVETAVINQNNYLQLRQLGELVGFGVHYNEETKDIELSSVIKAEESGEAKEEKEEVVEPFTNLSEVKELKAEDQEKLVRVLTKKIAENKENGEIKNITLTKVSTEKDDNKVEVEYEGKVTTDKKVFEFEVKFEGEKVEVELEEVKSLMEEIKEKVEEKAGEVVKDAKDKVEEIKDKIEDKKEDKKDDNKDDKDEKKEEMNK